MQRVDLASGHSVNPQKGSIASIARSIGTQIPVFVYFFTRLVLNYLAQLTQLLEGTGSGSSRLAELACRRLTRVKALDAPRPFPFHHRLHIINIVTPQRAAADPCTPFNCCPLWGQVCPCGVRLARDSAIAGGISTSTTGCGGSVTPE